MRDEAKPIKIHLPTYHFQILQLWGFVKSMQYSTLACNLVQEACENKDNQKEIFDILEIRAQQAPYNTTVDDLKSQIIGENINLGSKVSIPVEQDTYEELIRLADSKGMELEEYLQSLTKKKTK